MQQAFQIQIGALADQLEIQFVGLVEHFPGAKTEHLKIVGNAFYLESENNGPASDAHPPVPVSD